MPDVEKLEIVRVGSTYYTREEWVCAFNTVLLVLLERRLKPVTTDRQLFRSIRGWRGAGQAKEAVRETVILIIEKGHPVERSEDMTIVARVPGLSDPVAKVKVSGG